MKIGDMMSKMQESDIAATERVILSDYYKRWREICLCYRKKVYHGSTDVFRYGNT